MATTFHDLPNAVDITKAAELGSWQSGLSPTDRKLTIPASKVGWLTGTSPAALTGAATLTADAFYVAVNTNGGAFALALPVSPVDGQEIIIKDEYGHCGTNALTITGTVDGVVNPTINIDYGWMKIRWNANSSKWCQVT